MRNGACLRARWFFVLSLTPIAAAAFLLLSCSAGAAPVADAPSLGIQENRLGVGCTQLGPELCFNARDDNCNGVVDEGCGVHGGRVQFMIAWDDSLADVDLNVQDPKGQLAEVGRVTVTGLTKHQDCPGRDNQCKGRNIESVFLDSEEELTQGVYSVKVRLERLGESDEPVRVNFFARLGPKTFAEEFEFEKEQDERRLKLKL